MERFRTSARAIAAALALGIALTGCGSSTGAKKTVTVVQTFTSANSTEAGSNGAGTGTTAPSVTVAAPSATASSTVQTAATKTAVTSAATSTVKPTAKSTAPHPTAPKSTATAGPVKKVNPLTVDCGALLTASDVMKVTGTTISSATSRVKDVANPKVASTGSIRCLYGLIGGKQKVSARLTQYKTAAAAAKQVAVTAQSEVSLGAQLSSTTVGGQPAKVLLRDGALIDVQYGDWTLGVAVANGVITKDQAGEVTELASRILARVIKNAS